MKTADEQYKAGFFDELSAFRERVQKRAKQKIDDAVKQYEEVRKNVPHIFNLKIYIHFQEERTKRLGPGGLDPVEVMESLPKVKL